MLSRSAGKGWHRAGMICASSGGALPPSCLLCALDLVRRMRFPSDSPCGRNAGSRSCNRRRDNSFCSVGETVKVRGQALRLMLPRRQIERGARPPLALTARPQTGIVSSALTNDTDENKRRAQELLPTFALGNQVHSVQDLWREIGLGLRHRSRATPLLCKPFPDLALVGCSH